MVNKHSSLSKLFHPRASFIICRCSVCFLQRMSEDIDISPKNQWRCCLTCQLSYSTGCQGLCCQGDNVLCGDGDYVDLAVRRACPCTPVGSLVSAAASYHQPFHAGLAVVDGLDVGAQIVYAVEPSAAFITQERFLPWESRWREGRERCELW